MIDIKFKDEPNEELPNIEMEIKENKMEDYEKAVDELCNTLNWALKRFVKEMVTCFNQRKMLQVATVIEDLDLSKRSYHCLRRANIRTLEDLTQKSVYDLMKIRNLGRSSLNEIISKLTSYGLKLKED